MRTVDLWQYLPPFLRDFREMDKLLLAEEPEFQQLAEKMGELLDDMFITTALDRGLKRYEALLGIKPSSSATVEQRRTNILAFWFDSMPFTIRALKERLAILQGNDNVDAWTVGYLLHVRTDLSTAAEIRAAADIITKMIPANLGYQYDFEDIIDGVTAWYGMAALFHTSTTVTVAGVDPDELTWLIDANEDVLTDEMGLLLFD